MRYFYLFLLLAHVGSAVPNAITYNELTGRFGNWLFFFSRALWLSYRNDIPLAYVPFKHSNQLNLSKLHTPLENEEFNQMKRINLKGAVNNNLGAKEGDNKLYVVKWSSQVDVDWNNKGFVELLRKEVSMIHPFPQLKLPKDRQCVAVHVRVGSGRDNVVQFRRRTTEKRYPWKFPPYSFYIEQLKRLSELLKDQPLYVHIITDSSQPGAVAKLFKKQVNKPNITYGYRKDATPDGDGMLRDFFDFAQFEYFVRAESYFSLMAIKLADWKIVISPKECVWDEGEVKVLEVDTQIRNSPTDRK